jgi:hypothetical protein
MTFSVAVKVGADELPGQGQLRVTRTGPERVLTRIWSLPWRAGDAMWS